MADADWLLGLGAIEAPQGVELDVELTPRGRRLRMRADSDQHGIATRWFARTTASVELELRVPAPGEPAAAARSREPGSPTPELLGLAFTQFALPVVAGADLDFDFHPAPNLHAPAALGLLLVRSGARTTLVAPLDAVHEQIVSVEGGRLRWGWHGDLDDVPAGFEATAGIYDGSSATQVLAWWVDDLLGSTLVTRRPATANPLTSHLSYWTDNGAAYWYRTEPGRTLGASVAEAVRRLRSGGVPVHAVELDSWFYRHEVARPITEIGYPEEVPPTGMLEWLPRDDAFDPPAAPDAPPDAPLDPRDAIERWADDLGRPPLVLHARHISPSSPYLAEGDWWVDGLAAQPVDPDFFRRWFDDAARWGACCIEQDWMLLYWFGVRDLRAAPGRARAWQDALDAHAAASGLGLLWCMATPADLVHAARLPNVLAVRTADDYRFAADPASLWVWYLTVNRLAAALGLRAFKDVFFSAGPGADVVDGDPHAELEALLSALSAGPVGIGDRIGRTDPAVVLRTCDADGRLRTVDRPAGLVDGCLFGAPARGERLAWATTTTTDAVGQVWTYVVGINVAMPARDVTDRFDLVEAGISGMRSVLDWRTGAVFDADQVERSLGARDWVHLVIAPPGRRADEGDLTKYVTVVARPE